MILPNNIKINILDVVRWISPAAYGDYAWPKQSTNQGK